MKDTKRFKVYVVGHSRSYTRWFIKYCDVVDKIEDCDFVLFTGGEDINPAIYNAPKHSSTYFNGGRDNEEIEAFHKARKLNKKMLGICRGAQLFCALAGGKLIQDMSHRSPHLLEVTNFNQTKKFVVTVNSLHHQMQYPYNLPKEDYVILGYTPKEARSPYHYLLENQPNGLENDLVEPEVVYYKKINALGIQSHPEMMSETSESNVVFLDILFDFLNS